MMYKLINKSIVVLCFLPYAYLMLFYAFVLRAVYEIGRIPSYNNPDPKSLGFDMHRMIIYKAFDVMVYGLAALFVLLMISLRTRNFSVKRKYWILLLVGLGVVILHLLVDPFDEWFVD
jgi:hypothetical protein